MPTVTIPESSSEAEKIRAEAAEAALQSNIDGKISQVDLDNRIDVLTADPAAPLDKQIWIKHEPVVSLAGSLAVPNGAGNVVVNVQSTRPSDFNYFSDSGGLTGGLMVDAAPASTPHVFAFFHDVNSLHVRGGLTSTWGELVTQLNAWAVANLQLPMGVTTIVSLDNDAADNAIEVTELVHTVGLTGVLAGIPRTEIKYRKDGVTIPIQFPSISLPVYEGLDPFPVYPGYVWLRFDPTVPPTNLSGQVNDMSMNGYFMANITSPDNADLAWFTGGP